MACPYTRWWSRDDLIEVLEGAGFSEVSVLGSPERSRPWLLKGVLKNDGGERCLVVQSGDIELQLERVIGYPSMNAWTSEPTYGKGGGKGKGTELQVPASEYAAPAQLVDMSVGDDADARAVTQGGAAQPAKRPVQGLSVPAALWYCVPEHRRQSSGEGQRLANE